jgi:hypothetical protein
MIYVIKEVEAKWFSENGKENGCCTVVGRVNEP